MSGSRVRLYSRTDCHLCDVARADLGRICAELSVGLEEIDVDTDPDLRADYGDRVPVIFVDGQEHGYFRVEEDRLRAALR
ncbi:MAG: glutaredoxin family protein [Geodermatophilaceae bacterium]|nr:glutaredoxin family protein [Geodermatophilaceae bacterium]MDQ3475391.1 glutaredoxin family protein [Actinomycetota bacterium]